MSAGMLFVLWKAVLGFGLPIALGLWELHRLRQYRDQDREELARHRDEPQSVPRAPTPRAAAPAKVLEPA